MPFFQGATNFNVEKSEFNDVAGNMTKDTTVNTSNNSDCNNLAVGSNISKANQQNKTTSTTTGDSKTTGESVGL